MKNIAIFISLLVVLLGGAWAVLNIGGQESPKSGKSQLPVETPADGMPKATAPEGEGVDQLTRSDQGGGAVNISATYITQKILEQDPSMQKPEYDPLKEMVFLIAMNTHSVDLLGYNMAKLTILKDSKGNELKPVGGWQSVSEGGHHRSGYLIFSRPDGLELSDQAGSLELLVKNISEVPERSLIWKLPLPEN